MLEHLGQVLPAAAQQYGDKTALIFDDRSFSFNELKNLAARLANGLRGLEIEPGDQVTLYSQNCWEWIVNYYAVTCLGAVINPINMMLTPEEVVYVVKACGARALLASVDKGQPIIAYQADTPLQEIILFGANTPAGVRSLASCSTQR